MGRACDGLKSVMPAWLAFYHAEDMEPDMKKRVALRPCRGGEGKGHPAPTAPDEDANGGWANVVRASEED